MTRLIGIALCLPVAGRADELADRLDKAAAAVLKNHPRGGLAVAALERGRTRFLAYGEVTVAGKRRKPDAATVFEVGSVTKTFTGVLLAGAVARGEAGYDDPVNGHMPSGLRVPGRDGRPVRLLHLATHTSSLPVQPPELPFHADATGTADNPYSKYTPQNLKESLAKLKLKRPIGFQHEYSNLGAGLLGMALADAAKAKDYEALVLERICKPLKLTDTAITLTEPLKKRLAAGHDEDGKPASPWDFACLRGCGAIRSTAGDLAKYVRAHLAGGRPEMATAAGPWRATGNGREKVGLCWFRLPLPGSGNTVVWHNGGTGGYASFVGFVPKTGVGVVVLCDTAARDVDRFAFQALRALDELSPED